jgi:sugar phosphate isomerase/epimerase
MKEMKAGWIGFLDHNHEKFMDDITYLAKLGLRGMEGGEDFLGENHKENLARFRDLGLAIVTVSADLQEIRSGDYAPTLDRAKKLGSANATIWVCGVNASFWNQEPRYEQCMTDIEAMEKAAGVFAEEGIALCYHNHFQDFSVCFGSVRFYDLLILNTKRLKLEPDLGWVKNGGEDPVRLLERVAPRLASAIHVKDWLPGEPRADGSGFNPIFTSAGNGVLALPEILGTAKKLGVEWAIVEQDEMHCLSPLDSLAAGYLNMKETGFVG